MVGTAEAERRRMVLHSPLAAEVEVTILPGKGPPAWHVYTNYVSVTASNCLLNGTDGIAGTLIEFETGLRKIELGREIVIGRLKQMCYTVLLLSTFIHSTSEAMKVVELYVL